MVERSTSPSSMSQNRPLRRKRLAIVMKGYPRLSETFIAQELLELQKRGLSFEIWALRQPYDIKSHPMHEQITAPVRYLPEYLHEGPLRVLKGLVAALPQPAFWSLLALWAKDLCRDPSISRLRRFGQSLVLARELPEDIAALYVHFLHTPASVTRYAARLRGLPWGFSAHAKDIWTIDAWEKREKIADATFGATCTAFGARHLRSLVPAQQTEDDAGSAPTDKIDLVYHGIDISRFPSPPERDWCLPSPDQPLKIMSVGRLVDKKGFDLLLQALAKLPDELPWHFTHMGGGEQKESLEALAVDLGLSNRIDWRGPCDQTEVVEAMRASDLFVLPSRVTASGDRDGLPNVLMEAASQKLPILSTKVSAIPEFIDDGVHGRLIDSEDVEALSREIAALGNAPQTRQLFAQAAYQRLVSAFSTDPGIDQLMLRLTALLGRCENAQIAPAGRQAENTQKTPRLANDASSAAAR